MQKQFGNEVHS